jgi:hypothetical protein
MVSQRPWQNPTSQLDVDDSGLVAPLDVLLVINELNAEGTYELPVPTVDSPPTYFYDCNGDGRIAAVDALNIINHLNAEAATAAGEAGAGFAEPNRGVDQDSSLASPTADSMHLAISLTGVTFPGKIVTVGQAVPNGPSPESQNDSDTIRSVDAYFARQDSENDSPEIRSSQSADESWSEELAELVANMIPLIQVA